MTEFETKYAMFYRAALDILSQTGSVDDVYRYIDSLEGNDGDYRDVTFGKLALVLASQHKADDVLRFCSAISDPLERADSMFRVARKMRDEGLSDSAREFLNRAVESAEKVERQYETAMVFLQVADSLERWGEREEASQLLRRAVGLAEIRPQAFEAGKTLRGCARLLASWNRVLEAIEVAQAIELPGLRATTLEEIQGRGQWPVHPGVRIE
jgi:tetratricopeptide (TPR) repeat protein